MVAAKTFSLLSRCLAVRLLESVASQPWTSPEKLEGRLLNFRLKYGLKEDDNAFLRLKGKVWATFFSNQPNQTSGPI